jgi:hypothetical protein
MSFGSPELSSLVLPLFQLWNVTIIYTQGEYFETTGGSPAHSFNIQNQWRIATLTRKTISLPVLFPMCRSLLVMP